MGEESVPREDSDSSDDDWDLPRIIVEDDNIIVLEELKEDLGNYWAERNVGDVLGELEEEGDSKVLGDDLVLGDGDVRKVLEELVGDSDGEPVKEVEKKLDEDFYKVESGVGDLYDGVMYDAKSDSEEGEGVDYEASAKAKDVKVFVEGEERRGDKSALEVAGFRDDEAERKRKEKRESFW